MVETWLRTLGLVAMKFGWPESVLAAFSTLSADFDQRSRTDQRSQP